MIITMLTTVDNPYNPFTENNEWEVFDQRAGYHTTSYLARIVKTSSDLSESDQDAAIEDAINQIVELNILGLYRKVTFDGEEIVFEPLV